MKVTKLAAQPPKPDIVITLSWEEAISLRNNINYIYDSPITRSLMDELRRVLDES